MRQKYEGDGVVDGGGKGWGLEKQDDEK